MDSHRWTTSGLAMTLNFDLLTLKSNQFIFVSKCTKTVNLVKLPQVSIIKYCVHNNAWQQL